MTTATLTLTFETKDFGTIDIVCEEDGTQLAYFRKDDVERPVDKYGSFTDLYGTQFRVLMPIACPRDRASLEVCTPRTIAWATPAAC